MTISITEVWAEIPEYEGIYEASNLGRIKSLYRIDQSGHKRNGIIRKTYKNKVGYIYLSVQNEEGKKIRLVHRLVAMAFIPNPENKRCINHIDNNPSNNNVSNLEWCTHKENSYHRDEQGRNQDIRGEKNPMFGKTGEKCPTFRGRNPHAKIILDTNTGIFYDCIIDAATAKGIGYSALKAQLTGQNKKTISLVYA